MRKAFTLIEIITVLVIIGILSAVAVPKFSQLSSNSKVASELATASTIQSAIDDAHSEWVMSEGEFSWGNGNKSDCSDDSTSSSNDFNCNSGYPEKLGNCSDNNAFDVILKSSSTLESEWTCTDNGDGTFIYRGPASNATHGASKSSDVAGKPDNNDYWEYNATNGNFSLIDN